MDPATKSQPAPARKTDPDFLTQLEVYLAKRDGVDKLLKISRYTAKILLASSALPETLPLTRRLRSFESSVGLSRKAFRLGKFVQDVNALRGSHLESGEEILLAVVAYGGEGIYYFVEQLVWLSKTGLIGDSHARALGRVSAWAELVGYVGSISIKFRDLRKLERDEACLASSIEIAVARGMVCRAEEEKLREVRVKKLLKRLSVVQDLADAFMAVADIRDGKGMLLSSPLLVACAGLLSALISTHKNWNSC